MLLLSAVTGVEADCADHPVDCDDQQILHDLGLSYDSYDQDHLGALAFTLTLTLNLTPTTTSSPHPNPKPNRISSPNPDPTLTSRRAIGQGCGDTRRRLPDRRHPRRRAGRAGRRPGGRQEPLWGQRQGADGAGARLDSRHFSRLELIIESGGTRILPAIGRGATEATTDLGAASPRGCVAGGDWGRKNVESDRSLTLRAT